MERVPPGIQAVRKCLPTSYQRTLTYKVFILIFTFFIYTTYHLSRKPISVVKSVLHPQCLVFVQNFTGGNTTAPPHTNITTPAALIPNNEERCGWPPFDGPDHAALLGSLDTAFLFPYAIGVFISGHIAERVSLRYFLTCGMLLSGLFTGLVGCAFYWQIHSLAYFVAMQVCAGLVQATGWPAVVTCVANWFGKGKRGFIMGLWNSHTSVGNILGSVIAGAFTDYNWGLSFIIPGVIIASMGILVFFFLVPTPQVVDCDPPDHTGTKPTPNQDGTNVSIQDVEDITEPFIENSLIQEADPLLPEDEVEVQIHPRDMRPISFLAALRIPGVVEFSLCLFFAKFVSYTFLFWLPSYLHDTTKLNAENAAFLSTLFDIGGIIGGICAGLVSDLTNARATTCVWMLTLAAPMLFIYHHFGKETLIENAVLLPLLGFLVNGPYALITTAVSADLGTHKSLRGNAKALATVTAIIDGTGSIGAAIGPLMTGLIQPSGWDHVFYMLMAVDLCAMLFVLRLMIKEIRSWRAERQQQL